MGTNNFFPKKRITFQFFLYLCPQIEYSRPDNKHKTLSIMMKTNRFFMAVVVAFGLTACGGGNASKQSEQAEGEVSK